MANEQELTKFLKDFFETFSIPPSVAKTQIWKDALSPYSITALKAAAVALSREAKQGGATLLPGALIQYLPSQLGHVSAEIAWNMSPKFCTDGGYVTDEIMGALGDCESAINRNDMVAARMAFLESYRARVRAAETCKRPARWWFTAPDGASQDQKLQLKEIKTIEAYGNGWLSYEIARKRVENIYKERGTLSAQGAALLESPDLQKPLTEIGLQKTLPALKALPAQALALIDQYATIKAQLTDSLKQAQESKKISEAQAQEHKQKVLDQARKILE